MLTNSIRRGAALALSALSLASFSEAAHAAPADLDRSFGTDGVTQVTAPGGQTSRSLAMQPDGKLLISGVTDSDALVARLNSGGSVDRDFGTLGLRAINSGGTESAQAATVDPNGKIVVAGYTTVNDDGAVYRLHETGAFDNSLDGDGALGLDNGRSEFATDVAIDRDGQIVVVGVTDAKGNRDAFVYRLDRDGRPDRRFGNGTGKVIIDTGGQNGASTVVPMADGRILVAGSESTRKDAIVHRLTYEGSPDTTFDGDGMQFIDRGGSEGAVDLALQEDGKVVVAGESATASNEDGFIARLNANGLPDDEFRSQTIDTGPFDQLAAIAIQKDGKIVGGGTAGGKGALAIRLDRDGTRDGTFGRSGLATFGNTALDAARGLILQPDGRIVLAGDNSANDRDVVAIRLQGGDEDRGGNGGGGVTGDVGDGRPPRAGERFRCAGLRVTIVGGKGRDRIKGTRKRDVIAARAGRDVVTGLRSNDVVCGGSGNDVIRGGSGRDRLSGGSGRDITRQ